MTHVSTPWDASGDAGRVQPFQLPRTRVLVQFAYGEEAMAKKAGRRKLLALLFALALESRSVSNISLHSAMMMMMMMMSAVMMFASRRIDCRSVGSVKTMAHRDRNCETIPPGGRLGVKRGVNGPNRESDRAVKEREDCTVASSSRSFSLREMLRGLVRWCRSLSVLGLWQHRPAL